VRPQRRCSVTHLTLGSPFLEYDCLAEHVYPGSTRYTPVGGDFRVDATNRAASVCAGMPVIFLRITGPPLLISIRTGGAVMNQAPTLSRRPPDVDMKNLQERKLLEAELFSIDMQVRNFGKVRDRLSAAGKDADTFYRNMQARRDQVLAALKKARTETIQPNVNDQRLPPHRHGESLLARTIAPARFISGLGFGFGTSGFVQTAPASEGINIVGQGKYPTSGEIQTIPGSYPGDVAFGGGLSVGPDEIPTNQYDPTINYFWLHNWKYLIPFPPPTVTSHFTYSFQTYVEADVFLNSGPANLMSFVSVGETANLTTWNDVVVMAARGGSNAAWASLQWPLRPHRRSGSNGAAVVHRTGGPRPRSCGRRGSYRSVGHDERVRLYLLRIWLGHQYWLSKYDRSSGLFL
jgi:hypothetical protein